LREKFRNLLADSPARSGNNGHTAIELAHDDSSVLNESFNRLTQRCWWSNTELKPCQRSRRAAGLRFHGPGHHREWRGAAPHRYRTRKAAPCLSAQEIDYINAHGTATPVGDVVETQAIRQVFGAHASCVAVSSTKSMHGHLMGATGAVEFAVAVLAIRHQAIPPTAHLRVADPDCDLDYVANAGRHDVKVRAAMSNAFAFGGSNAVLIARAV
jgi:hypothetical protein